MTMTELPQITSAHCMVTALPARLEKLLTEAGYGAILVAARHDGKRGAPVDQEALSTLLASYDVDATATDACHRIAEAFYPDGDLGAEVGADELQATCNILFTCGLAAAQFRNVFETELRRIGVPLGVITVEMKDEEVQLVYQALAQHLAVDSFTSHEVLEWLREIPRGTEPEALWSALIAANG